MRPAPEVALISARTSGRDVIGVLVGAAGGAVHAVAGEVRAAAAVSVTDAGQSIFHLGLPAGGVDRTVATAGRGGGRQRTAGRLSRARAGAVPRRPARCRGAGRPGSPGTGRGRRGRADPGRRRGHPAGRRDRGAGSVAGTGADRLAAHADLARGGQRGGSGDRRGARGPPAVDRRRVGTGSDLPPPGALRPRGHLHLAHRAERRRAAGPGGDRRPGGRRPAALHLDRPAAARAAADRPGARPLGPAAAARRRAGSARAARAAGVGGHRCAAGGRAGRLLPVVHGRGRHRQPASPARRAPPYPPGPDSLLGRRDLRDAVARGGCPGAGPQPRVVPRAGAATYLVNNIDFDRWFTKRPGQRVPADLPRLPVEVDGHAAVAAKSSRRGGSSSSWPRARRLGR